MSGNLDERLKCEHPGCDGNAIECHLNDDENTVEHFCANHCYENGYCFGCGGFWCGIESFDFNNESHLCENCHDEIDDEDQEIPYDPELGEAWECGNHE